MCGEVYVITNDKVRKANSHIKTNLQQKKWEKNRTANDLKEKNN